MKKSAFILALLMLICCACGEKKSADGDSPQDTEAVQQETRQPDPYSVQTTKSKSEKKTAETTTSAEKSAVQTTETTAKKSSSSETTASAESADPEKNDDSAEPDPLGNGAFSYDENGAVEFEEEPETDNTQLMISAGQALFESACRYQWIFTVGCPYAIDENDTIQNDFGWTFYRIKDGNIHSLADIENHYHEVFSERYPNEDLKMLYIESGGAVYALNGMREMNDYYSVSKITDIQSRSNDEIFFTVENYYEGTDMNPDESYSEKETFSMVLEGNKIKVGQFRLPY